MMLFALAAFLAAIGLGLVSLHAQFMPFGLQGASGGGGGGGCATGVTQLDTFVDAGAPINLSAHTPTVCGSWTLFSGTATDYQIDTTGALGIHAGNSASTLVLATDTGSTNQVVEVVWGTGTAAALALVMRAVASGDGIDVLINYGGSGTSYIVDRVADNNSGSVTTCTVTLTFGHTYRAELSGSSFTLKDNGSLLSSCNFTTTHYTTGLHVGVRGLGLTATSSLLTSWKSGSGF